MSQSRGYFDDSPELESALEWAERWYHVPVLLVLLGFMLWNRVRNWQQFVVDGQVYFSGNDAWYHLRSTTYTVQNWPFTMPFDPWTHFPYGTSSGQFGTLFDQIIATAALIIGLGSPSDQTIALTVLFAPAVFGTVAAVPVYFIGKRLGGRISGVTAVAVLALSAGSFLQRSMVGFSDHHVAEALFQTVGVLGVMVAVSVAARDKPIYEQFLERDVNALRDTLGWAVLAGFAISLYLWTWPPGVLLIGILGVFFLLRLSIEYLQGHSPEHTAIAGAITMVTVTALTLTTVTNLEINATSQSLLQPLLALSVGIGCVFMAWLARVVERRDYERYVYPVSVLGILVTGAVLMAVLLPDLWSFFVNNVSRVIGFATSVTGGTVGEVTPLRDPSQLYRQHGLAVLVAGVGGIFLLGKQLLYDDAPAEELLVVVWGTFLLLATFTQQRFAYYLVMPIAVLTGMFVGRVVTWSDLSPDDGVEYYQILTILTLLLVIVAPLVLMAPTALDYGDAAGPGESIQSWDESLQWMQTNTPEEGAYGTGDESRLDYYGTYQAQEDFDYQTGEYGVLSWWDYGHWITTRGERIPNANPFQQGSDSAANFLLAPNETQANSVLDGIDEDDAKTRYVAVDWKMTNVYGGAGGKFFAPPQFYDVSEVSQSDYYGQIVARETNQRFYYRTQNYYESQVVRLYEYHGSAVEPQPIVLDWERVTSNGRTVRATPEDGRAIKEFQNMSAAQAYVEEDDTSQIGGFGTAPAERIPAMEHYRYVGSSSTSAYESDGHNQAMLIEAQSIGITPRPADGNTCSEQETEIPLRGTTWCLPTRAVDVIQQNNPAWTKVFERVPGATIEGTGPANTTVNAAVQMRNHETNETFIYRQQVETDENGNFEMTVPYSTTGYDEWGTENGYTNVSVRAESSYQFTAVGVQNGQPTSFVGATEVSEGKVIGEDDSPATVELEPVTANQGNGDNGDS